MKRERIIITAALILMVFIFNAFGQNSDNKNGADYALRGSERINASTLGMQIDIPLGNYPGRGINVPINLSYSSKVWRMEFTGNQPVAGGNSSSCYANYLARYSEESASGWTSSLKVPHIEYTGAENLYNADGTPISYDAINCPTTDPPTGNYPVYYVRRLVIHLPSGETHELRANDTVLNYAIGNGINPSDWNTTFYAVDGSNIKYVQDSTTGTFRLLMSDGSFYDFETFSYLADRKATKFTDRNGNYITYHNDDTTNYPNGYWKDTLGKNIPAPIKPNAPNQPTTASSPQIYSMPGMNAETPVTYKLQWKQLKSSSAAESGLTDFSLSLKPIGDAYGCLNGSGFPTTCVRPAGNSLFGGGGNSTGPRVVDETIFNPIVLTEIELPTGQKYKFSYDIYGRIEAITYPTGGKEEFIYNVVPTLSVLEYDNITGQANFGVTHRKLYPNANQSANYQWTYEAGYVTPQGYKVTINNPDQTRTERFLRRGNDAGTFSGFGYDNSLAGMVYEEKLFDNSNPSKLVSKKLTNWTITQLQTSNGAINQTAHWHPRVAQEESIVYDALDNGVSATTTYDYEGDLSLRDTPVLMKKGSQYAFVTAGSALPANPVRSSETTFLINDSHYSGTAYLYKNQNMVGLVTASVIRNGVGQIVSRSEMIYDESGYSPNVGRGNPTTAKVWVNTKDSDWNNPYAYISTHARFDTYGNQYASVDGKGNSTTTTFDPTYHTFPITITTAVPDPSNMHGSNTAFQTSATFNTVVGLPLTNTDINGQTTTIEYDPVTLRLIRVTPPAGAGISETIYHDEPNNYWVKSRTQIDANNWSESITYFDGLSRAYKTEQIASQGNVFVEKEFDAEGRVSRVTNPFRSNETKQWTTNVYDEASRIKEVTMPGGAKVKTDYGISTSGIIGVTKQITDQAGKKRKGISDALGRMVRVIEDPTGQNLSTDYVFDTLGNLRRTTQGEQNRYFSYDSLGRMLYAKQPEQDANGAFIYTDSITGNTAWSVKYVYDDNGNTTSTTDAKNITVTGIYDNLDRIKTQDYSDSTPDVGFYYDGRGLGAVPNFSKGKTTKVANSISETRYTSFNNLGRLLTSEQRTPFGTETAEQATPRISAYQYDAYGNLLSETYPSGRTVKIDYNSDGNVSSVSGKVGVNNRLYANGFSYNASGAMERMRLGNGRWETAIYNNRSQVTEIGLGYSATDKSLLKLEYGYGIAAENNGNLRSQKISFNGLAQPFEQTYVYDSLNRLQSAEEKVNSQTTWKQTFSIDRYGNRSFDAANTTTMGSCPQVVCNPLINTSNNRFSSGQGYSYDANGNLIIDAEGKQFLYDAEDNQKEIKNSSNQTIGLYLYDGEGKRVKKITSTENVVFVYDGGGTLVAEYSTQLAPTPQVSYLTDDYLGSPRLTTDQNGTVTKRQDFAAFGDETITSQRNSALKYTTSDEIRKDYTGYEKDNESGLEFAQARYYSSTHGRFTSIDPLMASADTKNPQTFNRYSYVLNSPYKFTDPLGLISIYVGSQCGTWCVNSDGSNGVTNFDDVTATRWTRAKEPAPPYAGGVRIAAGLSEDDVKALIDVFEEVYGTEGGYNFFNSFNDVAYDSTLILTVGDLSADDTKDAKGNVKTTWGKTSASRDENGHVTITITIDVKRIDKAVADQRREQSANRDKVVGQTITTGVETGQSVGRHEVAHGMHVMNKGIDDYLAQVKAGTAEKEREAFQNLPTMKRDAPQLKGKKKSDEFKKLVGFSTYKFEKKS